MRHRTRYTETAPCPRPGCEGSVTIYVTNDPGRTTGDPADCWPPEYEAEPHECSECGAEDWTDDELSEMLAVAEEDWPDDGPEDDR